MDQDNDDGHHRALVTEPQNESKPSRAEVERMALRDEPIPVGWHQ